MACDSGAIDDPGCHECIVVDGYLCTGEPSVCEWCGLGRYAVYPTNGTPAYCMETCGDGWILQDDCDDGNTEDDDGCENCKITEGWSCIGEPSICGEYEEIDNFGDDADDQGWNPFNRD